MLRRKISEYFVNWTEKSRKRVLVIEGPRQVGKTTSINEFIVNHYDDKFYYHIDFKDNYALSRIFKREFEVSRIYQELQLHYPDKQLVENETIFFFDNIQLCPEIIPYFRAFTEDGFYDVIAAGSSLGVIYETKQALPIGYVDRYSMSGLDFEEYLWATGYDDEQVQYFKDLNNNDEIKTSSIHGVLIDLFREYIAIGGMPEVVVEYLKQNNFKLAYEIQKNILEIYYDEMEIHAKKILYPKIVECFDSIPKQLEKDNKKFQYRFVSDKGRATVYKSSVEWLINSGLVVRSNNLVKPIRPLNENIKKDNFKLYIHDPGLLVAMFGENTQLEILKGNLLIHNGAVLENTIGSMLDKEHFDLYYFEKNSTLDIDFVISRNLVVTPVIVKEADNNKSKTLKSLESKFGIFTGIRLSSLTNITNQNKNLIPVYMAMDL